MTHNHDNIGIQIYRKELTKTFIMFMMISNWKKPFGFQDFYNIISALQGLIVFDMFPKLRF